MKSNWSANLWKSSLFSAASAFRGTMYRIFPRLDASIFSAGTMPMRDFPLAVGIATTRFFPSRAMGIASACGGCSSLNPADIRASETASGTSSSSTLMDSVILGPDIKSRTFGVPVAHTFKNDPIFLGPDEP